MVAMSVMESETSPSAASSLTRLCRALRWVIMALSVCMRWVWSVCGDSFIVCMGMLHESVSFVYVFYYVTMLICRGVWLWPARMSGIVTEGGASPRPYRSMYRFQGQFAIL